METQVKLISSIGTLELVNGKNNPLTQWDLNRKLKVNNFDSAKYVHFWHTVESKGYTVEIKEYNGQRYAEIPNIMLQKVGDIAIYISNGTWSIYQMTLSIEVNEEFNKENYENSYTWTQVVLETDMFNQLLNLTNNNLNNLVTKNELKLLLENIKILENKLNNNFANSLKGSANGEIVSITDVSPIEHQMKVKASNKNLAFINEYELLGKACNEVIFEGYLPNGGILSFTKDFDPKDGAALFGVYEAENTDLGEGIQWVSAQDTVRKINPYDKKIQIKLLNWGSNKGNVSNIQLELGTKATEYTPHLVDLSGVKLLKQGKNLLNTLNRTFGGSLGIVANTAQRKFEFDKYYIGLSQNNYYTGEKGCKAELNGDIWTIDWSFGGDISYGLAFPVKVKPNISYTLKAKNITEYYYGRICYYDKDGNYLNKDVALANTDKFTTPDNCEIAAIIFAQGKGITTKSTIQIKDIQLELSGTATEYEPYIESIEYPISADGTVEGITSLYPVTTLTTDTNGVLVEAKYNRDLNKAFSNLENKIGGIILYEDEYRN